MIGVLKGKFAEILQDFLSEMSVEEIKNMIEIAPENISGDLAFPCFTLAKLLKKSPNIIAEELTGKLSSELKTSVVFSGFVFVGGYVNAHVKSEILAEKIVQQVLKEKDNFGKGEKKTESYMIEGWALNTHKSAHIGHVRNILLSDAVSSLLEFAGYDVKKVCYRGDIGAHVAKWIWYYMTYAKSEIPSDKVTRWAGNLYVEATKKVDENPDLYKEEIHDLQKKIEDQDPELLNIWNETREACLVDLKKVLAELGTDKIVRYYTESEVELPGIEKAKHLEKSGVATYSEGAIIVDLEEYNLGISVILKKNGTSLYITKDLALADLKKKEFDCDHYLYVVGSEQNHHFQQLFKILELAKFPVHDMHHLSYAMVEGKEGKFSSRKGNVVLYEDLRDKLLEKAETMLETRTVENKLEAAQKIAFGALKFSMLLSDTQKKIIFDPDAVLSFEGETGPYIQYAFVRIQSILNGIDVDINMNIDYGLLQAQEEKSLVLKLAEFEELVQKAAVEYKPNYIARWCLDLAKLFNNYYHKHKILGEDGALQNARLALIEAVAIGLQNGLKLLGIETLEEM